MEYTVLFRPNVHVTCHTQKKLFFLFALNQNKIYRPSQASFFQKSWTYGRNSTVNGGDDVDDDISLEPCPTWRDVLKAVSTICRYTEDINEPIAQKVEAILGSFNRQICLDETKGMKNTILTDFFQKV